MSIPDIALERFARLRRLYDMARAAADGLQPTVEAARGALEKANRALEISTTLGRHRQAVMVGEEDGQAYAYAGRERSTCHLNGAAYARVEGSVVREHRAELDAFARAIQDAKVHLAEVMGQRREALERAAELRRVVEGIDAALRARGWREHELDQALDPTAGPFVGNPAEPPPNMFQTAPAGGISPVCHNSSSATYAGLASTFRSRGSRSSVLDRRPDEKGSNMDREPFRRACICISCPGPVPAGAPAQRPGAPPGGRAGLAALHPTGATRMGRPR